MDSFRIDGDKGHGGSGLGFSLARATADHSSTRMEVDSRPGKTEFIFAFRPARGRTCRRQMIPGQTGKYIKSPSVSDTNREVI